MVDPGVLEPYVKSEFEAQKLDCKNYTPAATLRHTFSSFEFGVM